MPVELIVTPPPTIELRVEQLPRVLIGVQDPHGPTHELGGTDPIDVTGLEGTLADPQTIEVAREGVIAGARSRLNLIRGDGVEIALNASSEAIDVTISAIDSSSGGGGGIAHATRHQDGGNDEINVSGLSGQLRDAQPLAVAFSGTLVGTRPQLNFVPGPGAAITVADNIGSASVDVTIRTSVTDEAAGAGLIKSGNGLDVVAADGSIVVGANAIAVGVISDTQHGTRAGGTTHPLAIAGSPGVAGYISGTSQLKLDSLVPSELVVGGAGLVKTGPTIDVVAADGSIVVNADSVGVGVISDTQHGSRGGGGLHALAIAGTPGTAGFISGANQLKLDTLSTGPQTPAAHAASHAYNGTDRLSVQGLNGILNELQPIQVASSGTVIAQRTQLNFIPGAGVNIAVADIVFPTPRANITISATPPAPAAHAPSHANGGADEIDVTGLSGRLADPQNLTVSRAGVSIGTRPQINLIPGAGTTLAVADNAGASRVDVTIGTTPGASVLQVAFGTPGANAYTVPADYAVIGAWIRPGAGGGSGGGGGGAGASSGGTAGGGGGSGGRAGYSAGLSYIPLNVAPNTALTVTVGAGGTGGTGGAGGLLGAGGGNAGSGAAGGISSISAGATILVETRIGGIWVTSGRGGPGSAGNLSTPGNGGTVNALPTSAASQRWGTLHNTVGGGEFVPALPGNGGTGGNSANGANGGNATGSNVNSLLLFGDTPTLAIGGIGGTLASTRGGGGGGGAGCSAMPGDEFASILGAVPAATVGVGGAGGLGGGASPAAGSVGVAGTDGLLGRGGGGGGGGGGGRANTGTGFDGGTGGAGGDGSPGGVILLLAKQ